MSFDRASAHFDDAAIVVDAIRDQLLQRLELINHEPNWLVDLGAGTGRGTRSLRKRYPKARILALDHSIAMARRARGPWYRRGKPLAVVGDATRLPFASASVDMVFANLTLAVANPAACLREAARVLAPGGLFAFASLGPESFRELRAAAGSASESPFLDMHIVGDGLVGAGLGDPVLDVDRMEVSYPTLEALLRELRHLGVLPAASSPGLGGRRRLDAIAAGYPKTTDGRFGLSLELVFGHAWAGAVRKADTQGEVRVPLRAIRSRE